MNRPNKNNESKDLDDFDIESFLTDLDLSDDEELIEISDEPLEEYLRKNAVRKKMRKQ